MAKLMEAALTTLGTLTTTALSTITGNEVLMVMFCGGLLGVGFKIIKQAKRAAK